MNETLNMQQPHRPTALGGLFKGAMSGLISGLVMATVVAAVMPLMAGVGIAGFGAAFAGAFLHTGMFMATCSTLFGGIMGAKHVIFDGPKAHTSEPSMVPIPLQTMSGPAMAPIVSYDMAPEPATGKSWVADTGRSEGSQSRIQQILADGSLSDKDRASAILASREAELSTQASRN